MAFPAIDNTRVNAAKHIDDWYAAEVVAGKEIPYASVAAACLAIPSAVRMKGRACIITVGGITIEHWWQDDLTDAGLIPKQPSAGNFVTITGDQQNISGIKGFTGILRLTNAVQSQTFYEIGSINGNKATYQNAGSVADQQVIFKHFYQGVENIRLHAGGTSFLKKNLALGKETAAVQLDVAGNIRASLAPVDPTDVVRKLEFDTTIAYLTSAGIANITPIGNYIRNLIDQYTGETVTLAKVTNGYVPTLVDNIMYFQKGSDYYQRVHHELDVRWWGLKGDKVTNNNVNFQKVLAYVASVPTVTAQFFSVSSAKPAIRFPPGYWTIIDPYNKIEFRGLTILGSGMDNTIIGYQATTNASILFDLGTFNASDMGTGFKTGSEGLTIRDLIITQGTAFAGVFMDGTKKGQAIRDNGIGSIVISNVRIQGYNYGFNAVCGSDYNNFSNVYFEWCNVGCYWGVGSEQTVIIGGGCHNNLEGMVFDRASNISVYNTAFNDNKNGQIVFETYLTGSRQIAVRPIFSPNISRTAITFYNIWMETHGGRGENSLMCKNWVQFRSNGSSDLFGDITFVNPNLIGGYTVGSSTDRPESFMDFSLNKATKIKVVQPSYGGYFAYMLKNPDPEAVVVTNWYPNPTIVDLPDVTPFSNNGNGILVNEFKNTYSLGATTSASAFVVDSAKDNQIFTGTTATWTWPVVAGNIWKRMYVKNRGTGSLTINSNAGANDFFVNTAVNSITINSGGAVILVNDGTYWTVQ